MNTSFSPWHRGGSGSPLVCLHGLSDTWRSWELVLPALERRHDVLAVTLAGHAGGPPLAGVVTDEVLADAVLRVMDEAGFETAHIVGNSLGGYVSLQLAARGRARSVVAFSPAGGWAEDDDSYRETLDHFRTMRALVQAAAPHADEIVSTPEGRRRATAYTTTNYEHIPAELLAHQIRGVSACDGLLDLVGYAHREGWTLNPEQISCPIRVVWGTEDKLLPWPRAAARYRHQWLANADWVELDGIGHCPQLDVPTEAAELILGFRGGYTSTQR
jgi:pimeloyl-ACP methyl ester carboxylesterase